MPTVSIVRDELFELLGQEFTEEEFDDLCFEFGLELDDVVTEKAALGSRALSTGVSVGEEVTYKIEVPANRYDLLCVEGLSQALRVFTGKDSSIPNYHLTSSSSVTMHVSSSVRPVRPFVVCAVLRGLSMDARVYKSLIDLQDKLHHNICRRRTLVAIGTHDLDKVTTADNGGTVRLTYTAETPEDIRFIPLARTEEIDAKELMEVYESDAQLKKYLPIIKNEPKYPVIRDSDGHVLSLPPIINGDRTKVSLDTKNILIECTATDRTKASIVLNVLVAAFSKYCQKPYEVEPVNVVYDIEHGYDTGFDDVSTSMQQQQPSPPNNGLHNGHMNNGLHHSSTAATTTIANSSGIVIRTPDFSTPIVTANADAINRGVGLPDLHPNEMVDLLRRMQLPAKLNGEDQRLIEVSVPIIRSDVLHACDIICDVAVAYGFNRVPEQQVLTSTVGKQQPLNHLSDLVRREGFANAGYTEVLTWVTVSDAENFTMLRRSCRDKAVCIGNPKTLEFEQCRTSLLPGLFKTLRENRRSKVPIRLFEVGDVVLKDSGADVGAVNRRKAAAVYCATAAGFEIIQGLLEHVMRTVGAKRVDGGKGKSEWDLDEIHCEDGAFFQGRRANIVYQGGKIGSCGWVHPDVLKNFSLNYPCSAFEFDLQGFV